MTTNSEKIPYRLNCVLKKLIQQNWNVKKRIFSYCKKVKLKKLNWPIIQRLMRCVSLVDDSPKVPIRFEQNHSENFFLF
jgi:hypothetical protein